MREREIYRAVYSNAQCFHDYCRILLLAQLGTSQVDVKVATAGAYEQDHRWQMQRAVIYEVRHGVRSA